MKRIILILVAVAILFGMTSGCAKRESASKITEVKVTFPISTGAKAVVEGEAVIATQLYLLSRAYCEKLGAFDTDHFSAQEYRQLVEETAEAFRITEAFCNSLESHAGVLAEIEEKGSAQQQKSTYELLSASVGGTQSCSFAALAYADDVKSPAVQYAEEITRVFDNAKNGQKLKTLAQQYGTDVKKAKAMLEQAQAVLEGAAYEDQAVFENKCYQAAVETKAIASIVGFGCAVISTGGAAAGGVSAAGIVEAGGIVCSGLQAVIDTNIADSIVITNGEGNEDTVFYEKADEALAPISAFFAIGGGVQNIIDYRDPAKAAKKTENMAQALLTGVGFVRDYVQEGKVLGVSANIMDGVRQIVFRDADTSDADAVKEVLTKSGVSPESLENADTAAVNPEETAEPGAYADAYIKSFEGVIDPANPINIEAFLENVDAAFRAYAEEEGAAIPETAAESMTVPEAEEESIAVPETDVSITDAEIPEISDELLPTEQESVVPPAVESNEAAAGSMVPAAGDALSTGNIVGLYHFDGLDARIEAVDDAHLTVTDVNYGEVISGAYDKATGVFTAVLSDRMSWIVTIVFTDTGAGIQADYENSIGGNVASASSAMKQ